MKMWTYVRFTDQQKSTIIVKFSHYKDCHMLKAASNTFSRVRDSQYTVQQDYTDHVKQEGHHGPGIAHLMYAK